VLGFVGTKMLLTDIFKIPIEASLGAVAALIAGSVVLSILRPSRNARSSRAGDADTSAA
jgi:tellurite resistance protein TerC